MAKIKGFSYLLNEEGQPISGASISIYLANSSTPGKIYTSETATTATSAVPQLNTNADGYFEFGLGYDDDSLAYDVSQKFKIAGNKTGITEGYNDYISIIPDTAQETWEPVDEEGFDTTRNKAVSNNLARLGEEHKDDTSYYVHGILAVDETDTNTIKNKLLNNNLAKGGEDHKDDTSYYVHGLSAVDETDTDTTKNKVLNNNLAKGGEDHKDDTSYYVHGIEAVNTNDTNSIKNKLISNYIASAGGNHISSRVYNTETHGITAVDINDYDTTKNKVVSNNDLTTLYDFMNEKRSHTEELSAGSFTLSGGDYFTEVTHSLSEEGPFVVVYEESSKEQITPKSVISLGINEIRLWLNSQIDVVVNIRR